MARPISIKITEKLVLLYDPLHYLYNPPPPLFEKKEQTTKIASRNRSISEDRTVRRESENAPKQSSAIRHASGWFFASPRLFLTRRDVCSR